jgi:hypothetical protein
MKQPLFSVLLCIPAAVLATDPKALVFNNIEANHAGF